MAKGFTSTLTSQQKTIGVSNPTDLLNVSFLNHFETLTDPRIERSKEHLLIDIVAIAILAVISGADGWGAIELYGKTKYEWLKGFLELPNGIPSHDTFSRVFARLEPKQFQECFLSWVNSITKKLELEVIAIDGKTMKQSYDRNHSQKPLHIVSAWSSSHQLVLGQKKVNKKSNEVTAIPALLEMLEIAGSIITIDALGCQKEIGALIIKKKGDYLLALKGNQKLLHKDVKDWFELARKEKFAGREHSYYQQIEGGHHRVEKRQIWTVAVSELPSLHNQSLWTGLKTVVMVVSERRLWNKTTTEVRFYLSSLASNAEKISQAIRSHWGIENSLHWTLDVTFSEDNSRIRKDHSPENFALLRRLAVNLLKQEKGFKGSLKMKRYLAGMDNNYLVQILDSAS
ncbi:ISAs1 family transposase [Microcoleus sp. D3_18a_C4]|uniref:ISAs1 family transposase n=1 Tax=Microcoleus sp. D3_18a_C4 TaxID=3055332 RepID=UPI002FD5CE0D